ncbi:MAG: tRNA (5-methylaminomethyl-2-thiouridylate)-methyltransferase, tRNA-specific 2-thiouridylase [Candidatus Taylorbacteria bacterium]|nr:tRNA (5-methylaminomethyl-2-thiouridylate)-methyltransferase, tRNA-specific 2-thiouridylase [Candidatus Taylorbacteria bacterium]
MANQAGQKEKKQKVFVGMSGGVDSSVSAALLAEAGYDVTGVFIKVWQPDWITCTWREDRLDAMRVAAKLGIDFHTLDLEETYRREVVDYMIDEYKAGRTPNPDVMCNRHVKFGGFFDWAMEQGADYVATGHYARVQKDEAEIASAAPRFKLLAGDDANKDQSYFLWTLTQRELSHTLFPVGNIEKPEVRKLAKKFGLPNAEKKDSQGLCFIGKIDVKDFLSRYIEKKPGNVIDEQGNIIGTHEGAWMYTKGERHGFIIDPQHKTPDDAPYYVVAKGIDTNTITVSNKKMVEGILPAHMQAAVSIERASWTLGEAPAIGKKLTARPRYRAKLVEMEFESISADTAVIRFEQPQENLSSGQSLVIYDGNICLGGGFIQ